MVEIRNAAKSPEDVAEFVAAVSRFHSRRERRRARRLLLHWWQSAILREQRARDNMCVVCECELLPPDSPPHCDTCFVTDEQWCEWEANCGER